MKEIRMGLERSRRPGILNLQSFRGSETLLRGINILPEFAIFPLSNLSAKILRGEKGAVFRLSEMPQLTV